MSAQSEIVEREIANPADLSIMQAISKAELDQQITTARAFPRSLKRFVSECMDMATLNDKVASECIYALPRDGKTIEGPSARLAEIVASAWGNCRAGARVVDEGQDFVTAQGIFHDLERNVCITYEVRRRITNKRGERFKADMIGVTGNAACSIAFRNAVFKGVPKAFWSDIYEAARKAAVGDIKTLANKRADALAYVQKMGATEDMVLAALGIAGKEDIGADELVTLRGIITAIKEGETTIEQAFAPKETAPPKSKPKTAPPKSKKQSAAPPTPPAAAEELPFAETGEVIAPEDVQLLMERLKENGLDAGPLLESVGAESLELVAKDKLRAAHAWIDHAD